jgi:hypothetical protein
LLNTEEFALRRHSETLEPDGFSNASTFNARFRLQKYYGECRNGVDAMLTIRAAS